MHTKLWHPHCAGHIPPISAHTPHTRMHTGMRDALGNACALLRQVELVLVKITSKRLVHAATTLALRHGTAHTVERCCTVGRPPPAAHSQCMQPVWRRVA